MNERDFEQYLGEYGLDITNTNRFLRNLDEKVYVNPALPEHQAVEEHVTQFVKRFTQELENRITPGLAVKSIPSGSYFSKLRVGRPYEFDFMLEIPTEHIKATQMDEFLFYHICEFEVPWAEKHSQNRWPFCEDDMFEHVLNLEEFMSALESKFYDCINNIEGDFNLKQYAHQENLPAFQVIMMHGNNTILLDMVPCVKFPWAQEEDIPEINEQVLALVQCINKADPRRLQGVGGTNKSLSGPITLETAREIVQESLYLVFNSDINYARLSTSVIERMIFLSLDDDLLAVLRVAKYVLQTFHIPIDSCSRLYYDRQNKVGI